MDDDWVYTPVSGEYKIQDITIVWITGIHPQGPRGEWAIVVVDFFSGIISNRYIAVIVIDECC